MQTLIRACFAVASGILLGLSFPNIITPEFSGWTSWLVWVALIPLLLILEKGKARQAFCFGWLAGFVYFFLSLYWISQVQELQEFAWPGLLALALYLGLYVAVWCWAVVFIERNLGFWSWLMAPFLWALLEFCRTYFLTGFAWNTLASSQYSQKFLLQVVNLTGQGGLSAFIVFCNIALYFLWLDIKYKHRGIGVSLCLACLVLFLGLFSYGVYFVLMSQTGKTCRVAVVQGNIDPSVKWNKELYDRTLSVYQRLTLEAAKQRPQLIVWPETAIPVVLLSDPQTLAWLRNLAKECKIPLLVGSCDIANPLEAKPDHAQYLNTAFLVSPDGDILGRYDKIHLVPFGEFIPFKDYFPYIQKIAGGFGESAPGREAKTLAVEGNSFGVLICFETIFPELSRSFVRQGASFLVSITNDGWYGWTAAAYQHASFAVLRAVENGVPLARAANTGVSLVIDQRGTILGFLPLWQEGFLVKDIRLGTGKTFYANWGEWFTVVSILVVLASFILYFIQRGRKK